MLIGKKNILLIDRMLILWFPKKNFNKKVHRQPPDREHFCFLWRLIMKHKYLIERNTEQKQVTIKEFSELDKEVFSFLCQETYAEEKITAAITKGKDALIAALRTPNLYPSGLFADKIAEAVLTMYGPEPSPSSEVVLDDVDFIIKQRVKRKIVDDIADDAPEIEDVLDDDIEEDFDEKPALKKTNSSLEIVDDEYEDFDDDEK